MAAAAALMSTVSHETTVVSQMMRAILEQLRAVEGQPEKRATLEALLVGLCNALALPMKGATVQAIGRSAAPVSVSELASTVQGKSIPTVNALPTYFIHQFPQISSSASTTVFYTDRLSGEVFVLWIEHRLYPGSFLLPCGYRDTVPPYIGPNVAPTEEMRVAEMKKNVGWLQSFTGPEFMRAAFEIIEEKAKVAGGYAKLPLHDSRFFEAAFAAKGFAVKRDMNSEATGLRELREETGLVLDAFKKNPGYFCQPIPTAEMPAGANPGRSHHDERGYAIHLGALDVPPPLTVEHDEDKLTASAQWIPLSKSQITPEKFGFMSPDGRIFTVAVGHRHLLELALKMLWQSKIQQATQVRSSALIRDLEGLVAHVEGVLDEAAMGSYPNINWLVSELRKSFDSSSEFFTYTNMALLQAATMAADYLKSNLRTFNPTELNNRIHPVRRIHEVTRSTSVHNLSLFSPSIVRLITDFVSDDMAPAPKGPM